MRTPSPPVSLAVPAVVLLAVLAAAVAWWFAVSSGLVAPATIGGWLAAVRDEPWAPAIVLATAAVFGPWLGFAYSMVGAFAGALTPYFVGGWLGRETVARLFGPKSQRGIDAVRKRGLLVVVGCRLMPVGPGTVVNLALGAGGIPLADFAVGTAVGQIPTLLLVSVIGDRLASVLKNPTFGEIGLLGVCVVAYAALILGMHAFMALRGDRR